MNEAQQQATELAQNARQACALIANADSNRKNAALAAFAENLTAAGSAITAANEKDLAAATTDGLTAALRERLVFGEQQINAAAAAIRQIIAQPDPIGAIDELRIMPSGIQVGKMRIPIGVLLMIYESRPNVTTDAAALALKAGNAILLRGGSEAKRTNSAIADCLQHALQTHELGQAAQVITNPARDLVDALLRYDSEIDMVIPRGGSSLIRHIADNARMPILYHEHGNCHVYIDKTADIPMATAIVENSKTRRYGVCNAAESLLLHRAIASAALPPIAAALMAKQVELRVCPESEQILSAAGISNFTAATEADWSSEYLAPVISIKVVASLDEAIAHINRYSSAHSDAIVSDSIERSRYFLRAVDSSSVLVNAATGFADGGEYGLGAEIGISTSKLHTRGPVGADGLTTQKYIVLGNGQCRHG